MTTDRISIPATLVRQVHDAMLYELGIAADRIGVETDRADRVRELDAALASFDAKRAIIDQAQAAMDAGTSLELDASQREDLVSALRSDVDVCRGIVRTNTADDDPATVARYAKEWLDDTTLLRSLTAEADRAHHVDVRRHGYRGVRAVVRAA